MTCVAEHIMLLRRVNLRACGRAYVCAHVRECSYTLTLAVVLAEYVHVCMCPCMHVGMHLLCVHMCVNVAIHMFMQCCTTTFFWILYFTLLL